MSTVLFGSYNEYPHQREKTIHVCPCGEYLFRIKGSTMLVCEECGETRWLT